jgi:hypothetical protein
LGFIDSSGADDHIFSSLCEPDGDPEALTSGSTDNSNLHG